MACYCIYIFVYTKAIVEFAWDEEKNRINKRKHGVSFETASLIFDDPHHLTCCWSLIQSSLVHSTSTTKRSALSRHEKQLVENGAYMRKASRITKVKRSPGRGLTPRQKRELAALGRAAGRPNRYFGYPGASARRVEKRGSGKVLSSSEAGRFNAAGRRCGCLAEEAWQRISDAGEQHLEADHDDRHQAGLKIGLRVLFIKSPDFNPLPSG